MARVKDLPCNRCGEPMWSGTASLPEGQARCLPCRRIEPQPTGPSGCHTEARRPTLTMCPWCWQMFMPHRLQRQICCSRARAWAYVGEQHRVRAPNDQHQERCERAKNAPGLTYSARLHLLARWKRQGKTCAYCDALATTVDHVVPLVRGGTNYEGNLTPCCKPCNSRKSYRFVIEWRTGRRVKRMKSAIVWGAASIS